jgi:hypothetical protein
VTEVQNLSADFHLNCVFETAFRRSSFSQTRRGGHQVGCRIASDGITKDHFFGNLR